MRLSCWKRTGRILFGQLVLCAIAAPATAVSDADDPFRLYTVNVYARDLAGEPVPNARVYAFNQARMMFGAEAGNHHQPVGTSDEGGRVVLRVPDGSWSVLGVGKTSSGRAWLVSQTLAIGAGEKRELLLEPKRALRVDPQAFSKIEARELEFWVRPSHWPRWWMPSWLASPLTASRRADRVIETANETEIDIWLRSRVAIDRKFLLWRTSYGPRQKSVSLAPGRDFATFRVDPPKRKGRPTHVFFVLEALDFKSTQHPFLYPMDDDPVLIDVPPGDYIIRHYVEWIDDAGKWHGEFANEHVRFDSKKRVHDYRTTDRFAVQPVFQVFGPEHAQLWLDALDPAGHRLDWFVAPEGAKFGELRVYDVEGHLRKTLDVHRAKHYWTERGSTNPFPEAGRVEFEADFGLWKRSPVESEFARRRREELPRIDLPHLSVVYPRGANEESDEWLEERATHLAPVLESMLVNAYGWYELEPVTGVVVDFHLCSPTAGGSSGRNIILSLDYLLRGGVHTAHGWGTYAHELGHSLHVIDPLDAFLQRIDRDHIGLYNESQASFMGSKGALGTFEAEDFLDGTAFAAHGLLRFLRGEKHGIGDEKSRLSYLSYHLEQELGADFSRRSLRLAHLEPRQTRDRIRAQKWKPVEKVAALFSIAADRDLTSTFTSAGFQVGPRVCAQALGF